jgi:predicted Rossmann fold flavoprotein
MEIRKEGRFSVSTNRGVLDCESLVIATGGLSMPAMGATNFGYEVARQFGMKVTPLMPALTPLRFNREEREVFGVLSGVSIDANVRYKDASFRDSVLFTHRGLSGPAILQISSYWEGAGAIAIDLLPEIDIAGILKSRRNSKMLLSTLLGQSLPGRFVKVWCATRSFDLKPLNQYSTKELDCIADSLHNWQFRPGAAEGFDKAEVTLGGVDTGGLSSKTMESKKTPGLYFLGEVIDVTGQLGGYNLHWAWASGYAAGQCV